MSKILIIGAVVLVVAIAAALITFKILPEDSTTGAATDIPSPTDDSAEESSDTNFPEITESMSKDQVKELAGDPVETQTVKTPKGNTVEYWYYESGDTVYQVAFDSSNTVSAVRKY